MNRANSMSPKLNTYTEFLSRKKRVGPNAGIVANGLPSMLFDWQAAITRWALKKGRAAIFADCGLGKTFMQVAWAQALDCQTMIVAPLCVAEQTVVEAAKLGVTVRYARNAVEAIGARIVITNYERIDDFDLRDYQAIVLDESSILKAFDGKTRSKLIALCGHIPYRLCCTATPSPNDIAELANHAEFLGLMTRPEFLATWFIKVDAGKKGADHHGWRLKGHARQPFYRWLATWAIAMRTPSDLGYSDEGFILPALTIRDHILMNDAPLEGVLFPEMGVKGIGGRLSARRASLEARTEAVAELAGKSRDQWLIWCGLNQESEAIARLMPDAVEVSGNDTHAEKIGAVKGFLAGEIPKLVTKAKILGFGMNFQNCHQHAFVGMSDSYEAYYQCIRRSWRFGQRHPVTAHVVISEAEKVIVENVRRKEAASRALSEELVAHMRDFEREELAS